MQDFFEAGGLRGLMARLDLHDVPTVSGLSLLETSRRRGGLRRRRHPPALEPALSEGGLAILRGSLAPERLRHQALRRVRVAADPHGPGGRLRGLPGHVRARSTTPTSTSRADSVLVLRNAGPLGGPGMPEWGMLPIPKKLLKAGVRDMVRISDARMSGTAYGTCVLHVAPESFAGGPLALVQTGDHDHARRPGPPPRPQRLGSRARRAPFFLGAPRVPRHPRLRAPVREPRHPGPRGLRLRLPPRRRRSPGARNPLMTDQPWDIVVVGAGILGLATARELLRRNPDTRVLVLERETEIASHQTGHNSGVIHAGIYYAPGSLEGPALHRGPRGPLRVLRRARDPVRALRQAHHRPRRHRARGSSTNSSAEASRTASRASGASTRPASARSSPTPSASPPSTRPTTGIIDFAAVARSMAAEIQAAGAEIHTGVAVDRLSRNGRATIVETSQGPIPTTKAVACAGLWSDRLAEASGESGDPRIIPFRGGYLKLKPEARHLVQVPDLPGPGPDPPVPRRPPHQDDRRRHLARPHRPARPIPSGVLAADLRPPRHPLHPDLARHLADGPALLAHRNHRDRLRRPQAEPSSRPAPPTSQPSSRPTSNRAQPASEPKP